MSPRTAAALVAVAALILSGAACSKESGNSGSSNAGGAPDPTATEVNPPGDIPDNQVFVTFEHPSGDFSVDVPEGWARTSSGGATTFTDNLNSVRIEEIATPSAPTAESVARDEVPTIESASSGYEAGRVSQVNRHAGPAVLVTYRADGAPDAVTGRHTRLDVERYEFWRNGHEVALTLSGPQGADNVDPWRIVTDSLSFH